MKGLASSLLDKKKLRNEKQEQSKITHPHGHSFDVVMHLKRLLDMQDPYLIFELNGEGMNENPSYIFKSSTCLAEIAIQMDRSGSHYMSTEWVFFDAAHKWCRGFKTFSITVFHPLLRKIVKLATMERKEEDTRTVRITWELFNKIENYRRSLVIIFIILRAFGCQSTVFNGWKNMKSDTRYEVYNYKYGIHNDVMTAIEAR